MTLHGRHLANLSLHFSVILGLVDGACGNELQKYVMKPGIVPNVVVHGLQRRREACHAGRRLAMVELSENPHRLSKGADLVSQSDMSPPEKLLGVTFVGPAKDGGAWRWW